MIRRALFMSALLATASAPALADLAMAKKYNCTACHAVDKKLVGPAYQEVAKKYAGQKDVEANLAASIKKGSTGKWGPVPMPPNAAVPDADVASLAKWIAGGAK
jgi:cytochrome c